MAAPDVTSSASACARRRTPASRSSTSRRSAETSCRTSARSGSRSGRTPTWRSCSASRTPSSPRDSTTRRSSRGTRSASSGSFPISPACGTAWRRTRAGRSRSPPSTRRRSGALARRMAASRTMISLSWSLTRQDHGEQPFWMGVTLAAMLGQIGLPGGGVGFGYSAVNMMGNHTGHLPGTALPQGRNEVTDFIPVARVSDMLLHPGGEFDYNGARYAYPDIRMVWWAGGNPFHHHQDLNRLLRAWRRPETIIVNEAWWNAMARHADIVLPCTSPLERDDLAASPRDGYLFAPRRVVEPFREARDDFAIFRGIARELGVESEYTAARDVDGWLRHLYDVTRQRASERAVEMPSFDEFRALGVFRLPDPERPVVMLEAFRGDPEANRLHTPSGRIENLQRAYRELRLRGLPGPPAVVRALRVAGREGRGPPPFASRLQPTGQPAPRPARQRPAQPRRKDRRPGAGGAAPGRRGGTRHRGRRCGAGVQRSGRVPRGRGAERGCPPGSGPALDRCLVRPGGTRRAGCDLQAREPERAYPGQGHVQTRAGTHRSYVPGRGRAVRGRTADGDRVRAAGDRMARQPSMRALRRRRSPSDSESRAPDTGRRASICCGFLFNPVLPASAVYATRELSFPSESSGLRTVTLSPSSLRRIGPKTHGFPPSRE